MNVVPLATALPYQVGIQRPAEEHFLAAFLREEIVEKMQGNGLIEFGAHGRTRTAGLLLTKEMLSRLTGRATDTSGLSGPTLSFLVSTGGLTGSQVDRVDLAFNNHATESSSRQFHKVLQCAGQSPAARRCKFACCGRHRPGTHELEAPLPRKRSSHHRTRATSGDPDMHGRSSRRECPARAPSWGRSRHP